MANWSRNDILIRETGLDNSSSFMDYFNAVQYVLNDKLKNPSSISRFPYDQSLVLHLRNSKPFSGFDISKVQEKQDGKWEFISYENLYKPNKELLMLQRKAKLIKMPGATMGSFLTSGHKQSYFADVLNPTVEEIDAYFCSISQNQDSNARIEIPTVSKLLLNDYWPQDIFNLADFDSPMNGVIKAEHKNSEDLIGINRPELLIGAPGACSPSTRAQSSFGMLNLLVYGGPAMWVTIYPEDNSKYVEWVTHNLNIECDAVLDGNEHIIPPAQLAKAGIRFFTALQKQGDLMVLFPGVFYLTWNLALTIQSRTHFIPFCSQLVEPLLNHKECTCPIPPQICKDCNGIIRPRSP